MRIIIMDRIIRTDFKHAVAFGAPRSGGIPVIVAATVRRIIFEVAVLNQFGIQAAVGGIISMIR